jgi:hypothetical protein
MALYVYGIVDPEEVAADQLSAVVSARCPLELVQAGTVAAITSPVGLDEFGEEELRERVEDLEWLEVTARGHEGVLEQVQQWATVVPMRLCTVYRTRESLCETLLRQEQFLREALTRLAGKAEWGVKIYVDSARDDGAAVEDQPSDGDLAEDDAEGPASDKPGADYMRARRRHAEQVEETALAVQEMCAEAHARLSAVAVDAELSRPQPPELSQHPGEMVLNGVYLVPDEEREGFAETVLQLQREHADDGTEFELTGPWPPYNFIGETFEVAG